MRTAILAMTALTLVACGPVPQDVNEAETIVRPTAPPPAARAPAAPARPATTALRVNKQGTPIQLTYSYSGLPGMHIVNDKVTGCQFFAPVVTYDSYTEKYTYGPMTERPDGRGGQFGCKARR